MVIIGEYNGNTFQLNVKVNPFYCSDLYAVRRAIESCGRCVALERCKMGKALGHVSHFESAHTTIAALGKKDISVNEVNDGYVLSTDKSNGPPPDAQRSCA